MKLKEFGVKEVLCHYKAYDFSLCHKKPQEGVIRLTDVDEVRIWIPCPNAECTSHGFSLIAALKEAIQEKKARTTGRLFCTGNESRKPGSLSCANWLEYEIVIEY